MGCCFLLQGIFLTQGLNPCLLHCRWILDHWSTWEAHFTVTLSKTHPAPGALNSWITKSFIQLAAENLLSSGTIVDSDETVASKRKTLAHTELTCGWGKILHISSVQFSHSIVSNSLWPHELQHTRPLCPSPTPGVYPNSCPLSRWCHPTISCSVVPFSSCPQSFPASGSCQMSQHFTSGGQSIGVSASTSVLPMNTQDWSPLGQTGWISLQSKGLSRVFSNTTVQKHQFFGT